MTEPRVNRSAPAASGRPCRVPPPRPSPGESIFFLLHVFLRSGCQFTVHQTSGRGLLPGITHWQHPSFYACFPANSSPPSVLAEMLTAALGVNCMLWQTSPAGTELETRVLDWLRQMIGLPEGFSGVIQDTASSATLCAILRETARGLAP